MTFPETKITPIGNCSSRALTATVNLPRRLSSVYAVRDNSSLHWRPATNEYARKYAGDSRRILKIPKIIINK